ARDALGDRIPVGIGTPGDFHQLVDDMLRRGAVRIAHRHVDDVLAAPPCGHLEFPGDVEHVGGQALDARKARHDGPRKVSWNRADGCGAANSIIYRMRPRLANGRAPSAAPKQKCGGAAARSIALSSQEHRSLPVLLQKDLNPALNTVTAYGDGFLEINRVRYEGAICFAPEGPVRNVAVRSAAQIDAAFLQDLIGLKQAPRDPLAFLDDEAP